MLLYHFDLPRKSKKIGRVFLPPAGVMVIY